MSERPPANARIERVECRRLDHPRVAQILVEVEDDAGRVGVGECWWGAGTMVAEPRGDTLSAIVAAVDDLLGPHCLGHEAGRIEQLWQRLMRYAYRYGDEGIVRCALSGIDLALWDLLARRLGVPVSALLGGPVHDAGVPAYASVPGQRELEPLEHEVRRALDAGFAAVKVHEFDAELIVELRRAVGPEPLLMVDALGHFSAHDAIPFARRVEAADLVFLETPIYPMRHYRSLERLRRRCRVALAVGEHEWAYDGFERLLSSAALDYVQPEVSKIGGLTFARRVAALAELHGVALAPHAYRLGPAFQATLHWALCSPGAAWIEVPFLPEPLRFPSGAGLPELEDGRAVHPPGVGLGSSPAADAGLQP